MGALIRLVIYLFQVARALLSAIGSEKWPKAEAIVTADAAPFSGALISSTLEIPYSYRFQGELYTGLHEEPSFGGAGSEFKKRFAKGRLFLVRVNPAEPEVSIMRERDQGDDLQKRLEQGDELQSRGVAQK
jgi:hypothetical protein